jgi:hypothetical protein
MVESKGGGSSIAFMVPQLAFGFCTLPFETFIFVTKFWATEVSVFKKLKSPKAKY